MTDADPADIGGQTQSSLPRAIVSMVATFLLGIVLPYWTGTAVNPALAFFTTFSITFAIFLVALFPRRGFALGWKMAPFPFLMIAALAGTIYTAIDARRATRADMDAFARLVHRPDGRLALPEGAKPGPFTRLIVDFAERLAQDADERDRQLAPLGLEQLLDTEAIRQNPALLKNCHRFRRAKSITDGASRTMLARYAELQIQIAQSRIDPAGKRQLLALQKQNEVQRRSKILTIAAIYRRYLDTSAALCDLLASASWQARNGSHIFTDKAASQLFLEYSGQLAQDEAALQQRVDDGRDMVSRAQGTLREELR
jgi:hypothetical protein